ncbi:hypothetical protein N8645_00745 [bacterium]|nr:hypothetical protein [bacterium]
MNSTSNKSITAIVKKNSWRLCLIISISLVSITWLLVYKSHPAAPLPLGSHDGIGWWGWFDQMQYLHITKQFASADFFNPEKYYPPLYPAIPSITNNALGSTISYIATDFTLSLIFFTSLLFLFKEYLNPLITLASVALVYGTSSITYQQWVIPWTTNLSSVFLIIISLLVSHEYKNRSRQTIPALNIRASVSFALTGLMLWVRPFEIIPAGVLCIGMLGIQIKSQLSLSKNLPLTRKISQSIRLLSVPLVFLTGVVSLYAIYNLKTFGSWVPSYSKTINSMGFSPWDVGFKFISLVTDSSTYGLHDGHLTHRLPLFIPLALISLIGMIFLKWPLKLLVLAALASFTSYLTFNDLVPTGLFTFNNLHYFTWSIAVIGATATTSLKIIVLKSKNQKNFRTKQLPIITGALVLSTIIILNKTPNPNPMALETTQAIMLCKSPELKNSTDQEHSATFLFNKKTTPENRSSEKTRLLELNIKTKSDPTQVHLAHQELIKLTLNQKQLFYRKDWRFVTRTEEETNKLSILLHKPVSSEDLRGIITIGLDSNIDLPLSQETKDKCKTVAKS